MSTSTRKKPGPEPTGKTPPRSIRVSDDEWRAWQEAAERNGEPVTVVIRRLMGRWVKRQEGG